MIELSVCIGSSCHLKGSYNIIRTFEQLIEAQNLHDQLELKAQFCMQQCQNGVSVSVADKIYSVSPETAKSFFDSTIVPLVK